MRRHGGADKTAVRLLPSWFPVSHSRPQLMICSNQLGLSEQKRHATAGHSLGWGVGGDSLALTVNPAATMKDLQQSKSKPKTRQNAALLQKGVSRACNISRITEKRQDPWEDAFKRIMKLEEKIVENLTRKMALLKRAHHYFLP